MTYQFATMTISGCSFRWAGSWSRFRHLETVSGQARTGCPGGRLRSCVMHAGSRNCSITRYIVKCRDDRGHHYIVPKQKYLLGIDAGIAALDICSGVDEEKEKELINIMKQIEECKRNMDSLDKAFDFLKSVLESAIYRSGEDNAITRMNLEDFTNRYLNSCLEIL